MPKYLLTGATGGLGSRVFKHLLDIVPASDVIVSLYNPNGVTDAILQSGVEIRQGNFSSPPTLDSAFGPSTTTTTTSEPIDKLLIVSYPSIAHDLRVRNHTAAIDAAKRQGVKHVFYTSLAFAGDSEAAVMQAHIDTERYLKESGLKYTIIREGIYNESYPLYFGYFDPEENESGTDDDGDDDDEVWVPHGDGGIAWACRDDLGQGTAKIIAAESGYENKTVLLSGSKAVTLSELAVKISSILPGGGGGGRRNRHLSLKVVTEDEFVEHNKSKMPEELLRLWSTTGKAIGRGELAVVDPLLERLLGRETKSIDETLREMLGDGKDGGASETKHYSRSTA